jgi:two-component system phosphate regulon sensor histidine kinase PhoR
MLIEDNVARIIRHTGHEAFNTDIDALYKLRFNVQEVKNLAEMVNENRPVVVGDTRQRSDWQSVEATNWIRSYVGAPIIFHGTPLGIINLDSAKPNSFNEIHGHRLMSFADQVAIALRNARHTDELAQLVNARTAELDAERRRMQTILEATGEGIVYTTQGRIVYANEAFYRITGYDPGTLEGQRMQALLYDLENLESEAIQQAAQAHLERAEVWRGEMRFRKADGSFFDAGLTISRADSVTGNFDMVTLIRDISTFKQLEAQKARFIANASHELRTPISSLNTRLYMMRRDPEKMEYHLQLLNRISEQMNQLIADMLDHSRFENGVIELRRRDVILQNIISDMAEVQRDEAMVRKAIDLAITMPQEPLHVFVDPGRIGQVLTNLISNAINYTPQNGRIEVLVYKEDGDAPSQHVAIIAVRDSGVGIGKEHLANIFEPFYRGPTEEKGTGLGLSISREIVQLHDGELTVESEQGVGSTFYVRLPMLPPDKSDKL